MSEYKPKVRDAQGGVPLSLQFTDSEMRRLHSMSELRGTDEAAVVAWVVRKYISSLEDKPVFATPTTLSTAHTEVLLTLFRADLSVGVPTTTKKGLSLLLGCAIATAAHTLEHLRKLGYIQTVGGSFTGGRPALTYTLSPEGVEKSVNVMPVDYGDALASARADLWLAALDKMAGAP